MAVPDTLAPAEVQEALAIPVLVEARHVAAAVRIDPDRTKGSYGELFLDIGVFSPESQQLCYVAGSEVLVSEILQHLFSSTCPPI